MAISSGDNGYLWKDRNDVGSYIDINVFEWILGPMFIVWIYRKYLRVHNRFFELLLGIK